MRLCISKRRSVCPSISQSVHLSICPSVPLSPVRDTFSKKSSKTRFWPLTLIEWNGNNMRPFHTLTSTHMHAQTRGQNECDTDSWAELTRDTETRAQMRGQKKQDSRAAMTRDSEKHTQSYTSSHTHRVTHTESHTLSHTHRVTHRESHTESHTQRVTHRESHTERHTQRVTHRVTYRVTHRDSHKHTHTHTNARLKITR